MQMAATAAEGKVLRAKACNIPAQTGVMQLAVGVFVVPGFMCTISKRVSVIGPREGREVQRRCFIVVR